MPDAHEDTTAESLRQPRSVTEARAKYEIVEVEDGHVFCYGVIGQELPTWVYKLLPHVSEEAIVPVQSVVLYNTPELKRPQGGTKKLRCPNCGSTDFHHVEMIPVTRQVLRYDDDEVVIEGLIDDKQYEAGENERIECRSCCTKIPTGDRDWRYV